MLIPDADTEIRNPNIPAGQAQYFLFDFDGTISTLRHGWEDVMRPVMFEAIAGDGDLAAEEAAGIREEIDAYIDASTGIQTIEQMKWLAEHAGLKGHASARTPIEYKGRYDECLAEHIRDRKQQAADGKYEEYIIPGAVAYLANIASRGATLMLISGTDKADVEEEARLLGVADFFDGGIHGSVNDIARYSKRKVIRELIQDRGIRGENLVVTGDGPVEIRCAREVNGAAVGVTCTESSRSGRDVSKYRRLAAADADIIITDFRDKGYLLDHFIA
ncbi:HAD family hydrolase [Planctomycetota bacterium]